MAFTQTSLSRSNFRQKGAKKGFVGRKKFLGSRSNFRQTEETGGRLLFLKRLYWKWFLNSPHQNFKPVILITGCGSGVGLALAELLYQQPHFRVVASARASSLSLLQDKFSETDRFIVRELDITSETQRLQLVHEINQRWGGVNILVNNAGISFRAVVEHMSEVDEQHQMAVNYFGPLGLIRAILPSMREKGRGKIINVSSVSGMLAMPTMASYSASKYALEGASEALWYEMKPLGIDVCLVQPGFIRSDSFKRVYYTEKSRPILNQEGPYCDYYFYMTPFIEKLMNRSWATPEKIAKLIMRVIRTSNPPLWVPATIDALVFYYLRRILPRRLLLPVLFAALPGARHWGKAYTKKRNFS